MRKVIVCAAVLLAMINAHSVGAEVEIIPGELVEFAQRNKCSQVIDFFEMNKGPVNPPYVYGYASEGEEESADFWDSAVFWCKSAEQSKKPYMLMFKFKSSEHELATCPFRIESENFPGGLSVYRNRKTTLEGFVYLGNPKKKSPKNTRLSHNAIKVESDGVEALFYCHKGEWLVRSRD